MKNKLLPPFKEVFSASRVQSIFARIFPFIALTTLLVFHFYKRGYLYPGWDILGAAQGLYDLSNGHTLSALAETWKSARHATYWNPTFSVLFSLPPAILEKLYPWQLWPHVFNLFISVLIIYLIGVACKLRGSTWSVLPWMILCSPASLSFMITGYPYFSGFLPYVLCFLIIESPYFLKRPLITLFAGILINELAWQCYQSGRTYFAIFFFAIFFIKDTSIFQKLAWLAITLVGALNLSRFHDSLPVNIDVSPPEIFHMAFSGFSEVMRQIFTARVDFIILPALVMGLAFTKPKFTSLQKIILSTVLFYASLLCIVGHNGPSELRSRRFLILFNLMMMLVASFFSNPDFISRFKRWRVPVTSILFAVLVTHVVLVIRFYNSDISSRMEPLPYTYSGSDYHINKPLVDVTRFLQNKINRKERFILIHNYSDYEENTTDPFALPERLYVESGQERFNSEVFIFGKEKRRYSQVPIHDVETLFNADFLKNLSSQDFDIIYKDSTSSSNLEEPKILQQLRLKFPKTIPCEALPGWRCERMLKSRSR